jgi:inosine/xanthosine triphosphatase
MKVVVGSQSAVKLEAVKSAFASHDNVEVVGVKADSRAPEQPIDGETLIGARNRAAHSRELSPDADLYVAIENGIFTEGDRYVDKAVVLTVTKDGREHVEYSAGVEFPAQYVDEARKLGFDKMTVGKVMAAAGFVKKHDDPHADLGDKVSRAQILKDTVSDAMKQSLGWASEPSKPAAQRFLS